MRSGLLRSLLLDALAAVLLAIYGGEVCPLVESLGFGGALRDFAVAFGLTNIATALLARPLRASPGRWPANVARLVLYRYMAVGIGLGAFNFAARGFPEGSGLKVLLGCVTLGLIASQDAKLVAEAHLLDAIERGELPPLSLDRMASRVTETTALAIFGLVLFTADTLLVVQKDLEDLSFLSLDALPQAIDYIAREFLFVGGVLVVSAGHLITSSGRNLRRLFENQTAVLAEVEGGSLERYVPVASGDEFGLIATHTNRMIDALRERRRLREVFGKIVSPAVARHLLAGERGGLAASRRRRVAVLFTDIRGFTAWTESTEPEALVAALNAYFSAQVAIVHTHGGVVDKFIGDGLMAVFGLDEVEGAEARAVAAARQILEAMPAVRAAVGRELRIGIGVHVGEAISGAIGSPDRAEFTVVGDAVNTASRVESLTAELGAELLITEAVWEGMGRPEGWISLGLRPIRGRLQGVSLRAPA